MTTDQPEKDTPFTDGHIIPLLVSNQLKIKQEDHSVITPISLQFTQDNVNLHQLGQDQPQVIQVLSQPCLISPVSQNMLNQIPLTSNTLSNNSVICQQLEQLVGNSPDSIKDFKSDIQNLASSPHNPFTAEAKQQSEHNPFTIEAQQHNNSTELNLKQNLNETLQELTQVKATMQAQQKIVHDTIGHYMEMKEQFEIKEKEMRETISKQFEEIDRKSQEVDHLKLKLQNTVKQLDRVNAFIANNVVTQANIPLFVDFSSTNLNTPTLTLPNGIPTTLNPSMNPSHISTSAHTSTTAISPPLKIRTGITPTPLDEVSSMDIGSINSTKTNSMDMSNKLNNMNGMNITPIGSVINSSSLGTIANLTSNALNTLSNMPSSSNLDMGSLNGHLGDMNPMITVTTSQSTNSLSPPSTDVNISELKAHPLLSLQLDSLSPSSISTPPKSSPNMKHDRSDEKDDERFSKKFKSSNLEWSQQERILLIESVAAHGQDWEKISSIMNRSPMECQTNYTLQVRKKGKWCKEEDQLLLKVYHELGGEGDENLTFWNKLSDHIAGRSGSQCMARYKETLDPNLRRGKWNPEELELLVKGYKEHGKAWVKISETIPGRTQRQCRARYLMIEKRQKKEKQEDEDEDIEDEDIEDDYQDVEE